MVDQDIEDLNKAEVCNSFHIEPTYPSLYDYAQLWQQAFFTAMRMEYKLEETVAYANGAVDAMKDKFKENTND